MPRKGRTNPCSNPLKKRKGEHKPYNKPTQCGPELLKKFRKYLPEYQWSEGVRLCSSCRADAVRQQRVRRRTKKALQRLQSVSIGSGESSSDDSSSASENEHDEPENSQDDCPPGGSQGVEEPVPGNSKRLASIISSRPIQEGNPAQHISTPQQASGSSLYPNLQTAPSVEDTPQFTAPTAPPEPHLSPEQPLLVKPSTSSFIAIPTPSPSTTTSVWPASSIAISDTGSVFHDEHTAKIDVLNMLRGLGMPAPTKKPHGSRLSRLFNSCTTRVRNILGGYAGEDVQENKAPCKCNLCTLVITKVKENLSQTTCKKERYMMMTTLPREITIARLINEFRVSSHVAKQVSILRNQSGPFSFPDLRSSGNPIPDSFIEIVQEFYCNDSNSRPSPNTRESVRVKHRDGSVTREPKRFMLANLKDTYKEFKNLHEGVEIKISKFAELRPSNCRWPGHAGFHENCTCVIHACFRLMLEGLKNASADGIAQVLEDANPAVCYNAVLANEDEFLSYLICPNKTEECFLGYCDLCPLETRFEEIFSLSDGLDIAYKTWVKNDIITQVLPHEEFVECFKITFKKFYTHQFIYKTQKDYIQRVKTGSLDNGTSSVLTVDFGENYSFVVQDAIQGFHWNNNQSTVHPFVFYVCGTTPGTPIYKCYFVISDEMTHDATTFHAFRDRVIGRIQIEYPHVKHIDYVSDGAGSQYKNYKNIGNLAYHEDDFNITARWIFTATSHGKSTCDAMSAVVKRTIRLRSLSPDLTEPITTPQRMFEVARNELTTSKLEFLYVTKQDVEYFREHLKNRYNGLEKIPGIRQSHHFEVGANKTIIMKRCSSSLGSSTHCVVKDTDVEMEEVLVNLEPGFVPEIGDFFAVRIAKSYQIGMIVEHLQEDGTYKMRMMKKRGRGGIALIWPDVIKEQEITINDILQEVGAPVYSAENKNYRLNLADFEKLRTDSI